MLLWYAGCTATDSAPCCLWTTSSPVFWVESRTLPTRSSSSRLIMGKYGQTHCGVSDTPRHNRYHLGQFGLTIDKRQPYEFDIREPNKAAFGSKLSHVILINYIDHLSSFFRCLMLVRTWPSSALITSCGKSSLACHFTMIPCFHLFSFSPIPILTLDYNSVNSS